MKSFKEFINEGNRPSASELLVSGMKELFKSKRYGIPDFPVEFVIDKRSKNEVDYNIDRSNLAKGVTISAYARIGNGNTFPKIELPLKIKVYFISSINGSHNMNVVVGKESPFKASIDSMKNVELRDLYTCLREMDQSYWLSWGDFSFNVKTKNYQFDGIYVI